MKQVDPPKSISPLNVAQAWLRLQDRLSKELTIITNALTAIANALAIVTNAPKRQVYLVAANESTNLGTFTRLGAGIFDANNYPVGTTFTLQVACQVDNGQTYEVRVYDVTVGAYLAGTISDTNAGLEVKTLALTPGVGEHIYELHAQLTTGAGLADFVYVPSAFIDVTPP